MQDPDDGFAVARDPGEDMILPPEPPPAAILEGEEEAAPTHHHFGPEASSEAPPDEEPQAGSSGEVPPKWKTPFQGLLHLGHLEDTFEWQGHRFVIRTLDIRTALAVGQVTSPYMGTLAEAKGYQTVYVAASLVSVDDKPMAQPLGPDTDPAEQIRERMRTVMKWYPATIDYIYTKVLELENKVEEVVLGLGERQG